MIDAYFAGVSVLKGDVFWYAEPMMDCPHEGLML